MQFPIKEIKIALLVSGLLLCLALWPLWPPIFYFILRWVVCAACGYTAFYFKLEPRLNKFFLPLVFLAILYNPIVPIPLDLSLTMLLNLGTAICLLTLAKKIQIP